MIRSVYLISRKNDAILKDISLNEIWECKFRNLASETQFINLLNI
jgi:hypothetical protein